MLFSTFILKRLHIGIYYCFLIQWRTEKRSALVFVKNYCPSSNYTNVCEKKSYKVNSLIPSFSTVDIANFLRSLLTLSAQLVLDFQEVLQVFSLLNIFDDDLCQFTCYLKIFMLKWFFLTTVTNFYFIWKFVFYLL